MKTNKAFTIVELLVVVGIIAILLVLMFSNFAATKAVTRDNIRVAHIQQIRLALEEYKAQCGEYPATLDLTENNGNCPSGFTLSDVTHEIPENESYSIGNDISGVGGTYYEGYLYSALSTRISGPCFEYHLGAQLEGPYDSETSSYRLGGFLEEDHDCGEEAGTFDNLCIGSGSDFDDADDDSAFGIYDFRSANNC